MPLLYEIDEASGFARYDGPTRTCVTCNRSEVGEIEVNDRFIDVGYCQTWCCFMSPDELIEPGQECWE